MAPRVLTLNALIEELAHRPARRRVVAIAGAPGSGKSTLAEALRDQLRSLGRRTDILQMDGFHFDDSVLQDRGLQHRKGAPETFDVAGFRVALGRLARNEEPEVAVPVFDRSIEIARAGALVIPREVEILLVEGNYLLLDAPGWADLTYDLTVWLDVPTEVLRARLSDRWRTAGLPAEEVAAKVDGNDLPNSLLVIDQSRAADVVIHHG